mmetsp:Transcript_27172/g.49723  ORF Transcript_27172/g.49723 Transcript_27172/m.49723 type:complete len:124 (+) Transcript_27172:52-423(+)
MSGRLQQVMPKDTRMAPVNVVDQECLADQTYAVSKRTVVCVAPSEVVWLQKVNFLNLLHQHPTFERYFRSTQKCKMGFQRGSETERDEEISKVEKVETSGSTKAEEESGMEGDVHTIAAIAAC